MKSNFQFSIFNFQLIYNFLIFKRPKHWLIENPLRNSEQPATLEIRNWKLEIAGFFSFKLALTF